MSKRDVRIKKLKDDSKILGVGSLFRGVGRKSWAINVDFVNGESQSMQFSNIPVLARRRVLNSTQKYKPAGLPIDFLIENAQTWEEAKAFECPAYNAHRHGKDGKQFCFVVKVNDKQVFIPQLEVARVLFYHDPFLARLSLQHNALAEDFMLGRRDDGQPLIAVREGGDYPVSYFNRDHNRRFLSWVLLDRAAKASFESISVQLVNGCYLKNNYQHWNFRFIPPPLSGVELGARGWEDRSSNSFFVWEVIKLKNLPSDIEGEIDFYHPEFKRRVGGKPTKGDGKQGEAPDQFDLDDDEQSDSDKATIDLISQQVVVTFKTPHITNRIPSQSKATNNIIGDTDNIILDKDLSPNEKEDSGGLTGGAWNNLDDQTDDAHLYSGKFEAFYKMIDSLVKNHECKLNSKGIAKLPQVGEGKKHWLKDTENPRCMVTVELESHGKSFILLEVDTSDGAAKLSTMLIISSQDWVKDNDKLIMRKVMKKSLGWPIDFFEAQLDEGAFTGIPHPKSKHVGALPPEVIDPWAERIANWIERSI